MARRSLFWFVEVWPDLDRFVEARNAADSKRVGRLLAAGSSSAGRNVACRGLAGFDEVMQGKSLVECNEFGERLLTTKQN